MSIYEPDSKWPVTILTIVVLGVALFVVAALLGLFADPAMTGETRKAVVLYWALVFAVASLLTFGVRHT